MVRALRNKTGNPPSRRWAAVALGGATLAVLLWWQGAALIASVYGPPRHVETRAAGPVPTPSALQQSAAAIRKKAFAACLGQSWVLCQDELDRASALDPAGDRDAKVQAARKRIEEALAAAAAAPDAAGDAVGR
jgi:hypothetical protein